MNEAQRFEMETEMTDIKKDPAMQKYLAWVKANPMPGMKTPTKRGDLVPHNYTSDYQGFRI